MGNLGAVVASSCLETVIVYGAETKNAQLAVNQRAGKMLIPKIQNPTLPYGPGISLHAARNIIATCGIRVFNEPILQFLTTANNKNGDKVNRGTLVLLSDFVANLIGASLTMPIHQMYNYTVTTPEVWKMSTGEYLRCLRTYVKNQYLKDGRLSRLLLRDVGLRCMYLTNAYTMYATIE